MVYSLVDASAIGFDVVRRPACARLGEVLLAALTAPPVLLWELATDHPAADMATGDQRGWLAAERPWKGIGDLEIAVAEHGDWSDHRRRVGSAPALNPG